MPDLSLRVSHRYVGTWRHLDQWRVIGVYNKIKSETINSDATSEDICEPLDHVHSVQVIAAGATDEDIVKALTSEFTMVGCSHEWDCCGCRSYYANQVSKMADGRWEVRVHSSRNF